ncbi:unnamed protein product [Toxocara canis]|uniref:Transposase n=1 Tax=Toxocara canis TaxID=6265 RepID=A0A183UQW1_TOXCA|nr:unnamed protein product [Toxocara canis]
MYGLKDEESLHPIRIAAILYNRKLIDPCKYCPKYQPSCINCHDNKTENIASYGRNKRIVRKKKEDEAGCKSLDGSGILRTRQAD